MKPRLRSLLWGFMALTLLLAGTTLVCAYDISFSDVPESSWFYEDVMTLSESGVVSGYPDGTYRPTKKVTTGESLKMILLAAGYPEPERVDSHWARGYLNFAIDQGFLVRYQDISDLDVNMTRGMLAKLAANALGLSDPGTYGTFTDTDSVYVEALYAAGIVGGYPDGTYRPDASVSRAEIAAIVNRIYQSLDPVIPTDPDQDPAEITLRTTEPMIDFIKQKEGFQEKAAWDYAQYSIGYGSACGKDEYPNGITKAQADVLLRQMLQGFEEKLDSFLTENNISLSDNQYDALISLSYNIGSGWMKNSALSALLKSGFYSTNELASAMGIWCHVTDKSGTAIHDGLIARRILEIKLFLYGDYSGSSSPSYHYVKFATKQGKVEVDIAFYESGSAFTPYFKASCDTDTFLGWYKADGTELREGDSVTQDMTLTAQWAGQTAGTGESGTGTSGDTEFNWWS